jgi:5-methylcytosine-specific restriction endonuclease McrA
VSARLIARAEGKVRYFSGKPCAAGHVAERYVASWKCVVCTNERRVAWAKADPAKARKAHKTWRDKNVEHVRKYSLQKYYEQHEIQKSRRRTWKADNPEIVRFQTRKGASKRRARMMKAEGSFTSEDVQVLLSEQGAKCICGADFNIVEYTIDHVVPISRFGTNWPDNLQLLCGFCNSSKYNKDMMAWLKAQPFWPRPMGVG